MACCPLVCLKGPNKMEKITKRFHFYFYSIVSNLFLVTPILFDDGNNKDKIEQYLTTVINY